MHPPSRFFEFSPCGRHGVPHGAWCHWWGAFCVLSGMRCPTYQLKPKAVWTGGPFSLLQPCCCCCPCMCLSSCLTRLAYVLASLRACLRVRRLPQNFSAGMLGTARTAHEDGVTARRRCRSLLLGGCRRWLRPLDYASPNHHSEAALIQRWHTHAHSVA